MTVAYEVTHDDITRLMRHVMRTHPGFRRSYLHALLWGPVIGLSYLAVTGYTGLWAALAKVSGATAIFTGFYLFFYRRQAAHGVRRAYGSEGGPLGRKSLTLSVDGFQEVGEHSTSIQAWSGIVDVEDTTDAIYLYVSPAAAYIVPKRAFQGDPTAAEFLSMVTHYRGRPSA